MEGLADSNDDGVHDYELGFLIVHAPIESPKNRNYDTVYKIVKHKDLKHLWKCLSGIHACENGFRGGGFQLQKTALPSPLLASKEAEDIKCEAIQSTESKVPSSLSKNNLFYISNAGDRIVLYYISLRGIRKTCENCSKFGCFYGDLGFLSTKGAFPWIRDIGRNCRICLVVRQQVCHKYLLEGSTLAMLKSNSYTKLVIWEIN